MTDAAHRKDEDAEAEISSSFKRHQYNSGFASLRPLLHVPLRISEMSYLSRPIVISFYTVDTPYQLEVLNLIQSCQQFDVDHCIEGKESRGSWERNVAMKPGFIRDKLVELKRPVFWVDADAAFLKQPDFEQFLPFDLCVREMKAFQDDRRFKLNAAALFFNYNEKMLGFLDEWTELCEKKIAENIQNLLYLDQTSLLEMIERRRDLSLHFLPIAYCKVFDFSDLIDPQEVVIEQYQASRRFRNLV
jgi:hypothetical protein